ncbi:MAG: DivIVA domain-containing protein [Ruminococcus sp.]|nr:DivIVA domain-containing protein [Ruminococcus sp.]
MITSTDIRNKKFEKAAFGYNQEEMDEFLSQLETELDERDREREEANKKINILADKVRDYMKDEDALKDALLGAQKQGHQVINEAKDKAERIIREAQAKADSIINDAEMRHKNSIARYEAEIEAERQALADAHREVTDFKKVLFDLYKEHLALISDMPQYSDDDYGDTEKDTQTENSEEQDTVSSGFSIEEAAAVIKETVEDAENN